MKRSGRKNEWFDYDLFWQETYPFMFGASKIESADEEIDKILKLTSPAGKVALDLCCGPGRCSIALARRGFAVTGIDRTKYLLDKARAMARSAGTKIHWVQQDMRDPVRTGPFDLVLSMFTSFGYFDNREEDLAVLANVFASLQTGGAFLIDVMGKERLAKILLPTTSQTLPDGTMLVQKHEIFDDWTRIRNDWILIRKNRVRHFRFHHSVYSGLELKERMQRVGFQEVTLYGNLNGDTYGPEAFRLIAVGKKLTT
jgi:SAM-dependent methyltransferase